MQQSVGSVLQAVPVGAFRSAMPVTWRRSSVLMPSVRDAQAMRRSDSFDSVKSAQSFISANSADKDGSSAGLVPPYAGGGGGRCVIGLLHRGPAADAVFLGSTSKSMHCYFLAQLLTPACVWGSPTDTVQACLSALGAVCVLRTCAACCCETMRLHRTKTVL